MMKVILKDIISGFHEEIREGSCREQLPFFLLEVENENAAAWNGVPAAGKIPSCISCSLFNCFAATSTKGTGAIRIAPEL